jgi:DNA-binding transcriptional LysR family regulator
MKQSRTIDLLRAMRVFVATVERGSMTAAADHLEISPTTVSQHLAALERRVGSTLLRRTTRRQSLTSFGQRYFEQCQEILALVEDAEALAAEQHAAPQGLLRITAPVTFGTERLMPALADFRRDNPGVSLDVVLTDAVLDLIADGFDAAIRLGELPDSRLIARPLGPYELTLCAAPGYLARRGRPARAEDLRDHDCLSFAYSARSEWRAAISEWRFHGPNGEELVEVQGPLRIDSAPGLHRAVLADLGVALLPTMLAADDLRAGRLEELLPGYKPPARSLHLVYARDRRMSPKLRRFIEFAERRFS